MDKASALGKIKKCLRLAKSANEHEAAAALRQAQKLMAEHGVNADDIDMMEVSEQLAKAATARLVNWEANLARKIADAFSCEVIARASRALKGWKLQNEMYFAFIGCGPAPDIAQYAYQVLLRQCVSARSAHIKKQPKNCKPATKTARGDAFAVAWVIGVGAQIERFALSETNARAIALYLEKHHPDVKTSKVTDRISGRNIRDGDIDAGLQAGRDAHLNRGVGGMAERKQLQ